jgi:hypothetical protein
VVDIAACDYRLRRKAHTRVARLDTKVATALIQMGSVRNIWAWLLEWEPNQITTKVIVGKQIDQLVGCGRDLRGSYGRSTASIWSGGEAEHVPLQIPVEGEGALEKGSAGKILWLCASQNRGDDVRCQVVQAHHSAEPLR